MSEKLAWGILGSGTIARAFARGLAQSRTGTLIAVGSRTQKSADAFAEEFPIPHRHGSYEALLADADVQAIYISTPHPWHAEWAIKCAEAGKHILCEKPIGLNVYEAMAMIEAAQKNNVFLMEAFMYRCHPQMKKLVELIHAGEIGQVRVIQSTFSFDSAYNLEGRLLKNELGGGGILDVGGYSASGARLIAGAALGKDFADPIELKAVGHVGKTGVDEYSVAVLKFPGEIVAQLFTGVQVDGGDLLKVFGSGGSISVPEPWVPRGKSATLLLKKKGEAERAIEVPFEIGDLYGNEADNVAEYLEQRQSPAMSWEDTLGNMRTLDRWREALGVVYEAEKPEGKHLPLSNRPLAVRIDTIMKYGRIAGIEKPVSRLVLGVDNQVSWPHASVMFDDFFERGGNCYDSAYIYGDGRCESMLGTWIKNRGIREQVVILDKGAHTPHCNPTALSKQFLISLERLQTDYVDMYMMHRDNPEIPVGEFVSVLNEHKSAGRMRAFGASNWSIERIAQANTWAKEHGLVGFSAMSNNFSLARMVNPVWDGCIAASDEKSRVWLTETQMPLMPWSSQARGFFLEGRADPEKREDEELVRCWYSEDNFRRLERVNEMAKKRGVLPINIALAYVLNQPFPTFPLIGPRALAETRTSFPALLIELTPEELKWLNLDD